MTNLFEGNYPIEVQIRCVEREISMRQRVYPRYVAKGNMTQHQADNETSCMKAVLNTLKRVAEAGAHE